MDQVYSATTLNEQLEWTLLLCVSFHGQTGAFPAPKPNVAYLFAIYPMKRSSLPDTPPPPPLADAKMQSGLRTRTLLCP